MAYDAMLRPNGQTAGSAVICYAADTLVSIMEPMWLEARRLAKTGIACAMCTIKALKIKINVTKTEATWLGVRNRERPPPRKQKLRIG